jgi:hypothetical protein
MRYTITMKTGEEYKNVRVCDETGSLDSGLFSILRDEPTVYFKESTKKGDVVHNVKLMDIKSAMRLEEFLGSWMMTMKGGEELPIWLSYHVTYSLHKADLDPLPLKEKVALARNLRKEDLNKLGEILSRNDMKCHPRL